MYRRYLIFTTQTSKREVKQQCRAQQTQFQSLLYVKSPVLHRSPPTLLKQSSHTPKGAESGAAQTTPPQASRWKASAFASGSVFPLSTSKQNFTIGNLMAVSYARSYSVTWQLVPATSGTCKSLRFKGRLPALFCLCCAALGSIGQQCAAEFATLRFTLSLAERSGGGVSEHKKMFR